MVQECIFRDLAVIGFQKRLCKKGLHLQDLKTIEDEILLHFDDLQAFDVSSLLEEVERLRVLIFEKSNKKKDEGSLDGEFHVKNVVKSDESGCFLGAISLVDDLNPRSRTSNFYSRMKTVAVQGMQQRSLEPFESNLTSNQKLGVSFYIRGPIDETKVFFAIDAYVKNLWKQALSIQKMIAGKVENSLKLFSKTYGISDELVFQMRKSLKKGEMTQEEVAHFMMIWVENQMGLEVSA